MCGLSTIEFFWQESSSGMCRVTTRNLSRHSRRLNHEEVKYLQRKESSGPGYRDTESRSASENACGKQMDYRELSDASQPEIIAKNDRESVQNPVNDFPHADGLSFENLSIAGKPKGCTARKKYRHQHGK